MAWRPAIEAEGEERVPSRSSPTPSFRAALKDESGAARGVPNRFSDKNWPIT